jgi:amidophosphoribosyltransferase
LIAVNYTIEEIRQKIGADSLGYLPIEDVKNIGLRKDYGYCDACFSGKYSTKLPNQNFKQRELKEDDL